MDTSCKVAELPQRPLRRVAVSLSQNETILLRVLLAAEGVPGPFRPQEDVDEKAKSPRPKKELRVCPNVGRKALQISA